MPFILVTSSSISSSFDPTRVEVELGHNISIGQPYGVETLYEWWSMKAINRTRDENNDGALPCPV